MNKKLFSDIFQMVAGNILCAFALGCFALPRRLGSNRITYRDDDDGLFRLG